jgi:hypothetical protein
LRGDFRHVAVANEVIAHWAFESVVPWEEVGVVNAPHKFYFVYKLSGCKGEVSAMVGETFAISFN